jgi:hypothetical protein
MIGSGFSRNADKTGQAIPDLPLWTTLGEMLYRELYPQGLIPLAEFERAELRATSGLGPIRLASEYEAAFGRARLNQLLLSSIRDEGYTPSQIHRLLLNLPWSDVFTTNYDTLLERTTRSVVDRRYDLVQTAADIPGRMKPRIVKLHGSFPSHRPFIITEEDYRTYPKSFAPFVNTVQQSIMENSLCLLGFSGDDPNFMYWTGWVRDNLGDAVGSIYLCGLLDLSASQRALLARRNVTPINLSPLFPAGADRHRRAMRWFLLSLMNGRASDAMAWPGGGTPFVEQPPDLPPILPPPADQVYQPSPYHPGMPQ